MLVCAIDIGSTNLKVGLTDASGQLLHAEIVPTPRSRDDFGIVTDPTQLMRCVEDMILAAWCAVGDGQPIAAISTSGVGEDGVLIDKTGSPLDLVIPWFDRRAHAEADEIRLGPAATPDAGITMDATRTGAKWLWLARHRPEILGKAHLWAALTDFPLIAWGAAPFISETLAARTGCYDPFRRRWIGALLAACQAPAVAAPRIAGAVLGKMTSARLIGAKAVTPETLLVAGGHDHPIAASAIRRLDPAARIDSLGTANVLYAETSHFTPGARDPLVAYSVPVRGDAGVACIAVFEFSDALRAAGSQQAVRDYLMTSPLAGTPGVPRRIDRADARAHSIREVLESASMTSRAMFDGLALHGVPPGQIYATGGWSRSAGLLQLRASILGQTILTAEEPELGLVGAALLAAEAAGADIDFRPAVRAVKPLPEWRDFYAAAYLRFLDLPRQIGKAAPCR